jgi:hypothetical protein
MLCVCESVPINFGMLELIFIFRTEMAEIIETQVLFQIYFLDGAYASVVG